MWWRLYPLQCQTIWRCWSSMIIFHLLQNSMFPKLPSCSSLVTTLLILWKMHSAGWQHWILWTWLTITCLFLKQECSTICFYALGWTWTTTTFSSYIKELLRLFTPYKPSHWLSTSSLPFLQTCLSTCQDLFTWCWALKMAKVKVEINGTAAPSAGWNMRNNTRLCFLNRVLGVRMVPTGALFSVVTKVI